MRQLTGVVCVVCLAGAAHAKPMELFRGVTVSAPEDWRVQPVPPTCWRFEHFNAHKVKDAEIQLDVEDEGTHAEALRVLAVAENERREPPPNWLLVAGWPAMERRYSAEYPFDGDDEDLEIPANSNSLQALTLVAVGERVVRFETLLEIGADPKLADAAQAIARTLTAPLAEARASAADLERLRSGALRPQPLVPSSRGKPLQPRKKGAGTGSSDESTGKGEVEAAVSADGHHMLINPGCNPKWSDDNGVSWHWSKVSTGTNRLDNDCTVAWGASGNFYLGRLTSRPMKPCGFTTTADVEVWISTDKGKHFTGPNGASEPAKVGSQSTPSAVVQIDQPHIFADRWNLGPKGELVYVVTQNASGLSCSADSGKTWSAPVPVGYKVGYSRVFVGPDGTVYVVSHHPNTIKVERFTRCDQGLKKLPGPVYQTVNDVACAVAGLDRCNDGNTLVSPTIAVDDTQASHVYLAWAQKNGNGGDDILVTDSTDGGAHFNPFPVALNNTEPGHRFMPWAASWNGAVYVGWYDRSQPSPHSDFTRYVFGSATPTGPNHALLGGPGVDLMGTDDPQCESGFPCGARHPIDDACGNIHAGRCTPVTPTMCSTTSQCPAGLTCPPPPKNSSGLCPNSSKCSHSPSVMCDLKSTTNTCAANEICKVGRGCPKYGDYNNIAVAGGYVLAQWAASTAPVDLPKLKNHDTVHVYVSVIPVGPMAPPLNACGGTLPLNAVPGENCQEQGHCGRWQCLGKNANSVTCDSSLGAVNECGGCGQPVIPGTKISKGAPCQCNNAAKTSGFYVCSAQKTLVCCPCADVIGGSGCPN